jgi:hypothetical protein
MASETTTTTTKRDFLVAKAHNFRAYLSQYNPHPDIKTYIDNFKEEALLPSLLTLVVPVVKTGTQGGAVDDLMKKLSVPEGDKPAVRAKLIRYLEMFATVVCA